MLVVSAVSQKGGVGKSAIARLIAREYAASGWAVRVADFDVKQMTTTEWAARRLAAGLEPVVEVQAYASIDKAVKGAANSDMLVIDGRGFADRLTQDIAKASNKILLYRSTVLRHRSALTRPSASGRSDRRGPGRASCSRAAR